MAWSVDQPERNGLVHVSPIGDLIEHELTTDCLCGPKIGGGVVVHPSLDGREFAEPDYQGEPMRRE